MPTYAPPTEQTIVVYGDGTAYLPLPAYVVGSITAVSAPTGYTVPSYIEADGYLVATDSTGVRRSAIGSPWPVADETRVGSSWRAGVPYSITALFGGDTVVWTEAEALDELARLTQAETAPELEPDDLATALRAGTLPDSSGRAPGDPAWTPTYDLNLAAAAGWEMKAGKAASAQLATGGALSRIEDRGTAISYATGNGANVVSHAREMAALYRARSQAAQPSGAGVW